MAFALLQTKLFAPPARPGLVDRTRLLQILDRAGRAGCRCGLVCAPAGFGKTTLVVQWLAQSGLPFAWLSLDEGDNQRARFFAYLIAALQRLNPELGQDLPALLDAPHPDFDEIITVLANQLSMLPEPFVLVLDDYQRIHDAAVHRALALLLEAQPESMRLALITRADPPLPLARLRARGQLVELRAEHLRFSQVEAADFLNHCAGLALTVEQVAALEARTEGWIAGLQMAALSMQTSTDRAGFIDAFSGTHRFILDYLMEEVLASQPPEVQSFLLHTCVLDRLSGDLCDAVWQGPMPAQDMLEALERANLFLIPLDLERRSYRYHHLFADLLRARLASVLPDLAPELHRRASAWYEQAGDSTPAVDHALSAGDLTRAADLLERHIIRKWLTPDLDFFGLMGQLPEQVIRARPLACLINAWFRVITGQVEAVLPLVELAEQSLDGARADEPGLRAFARILRAFIADMRNQPAAVDAELRQALEAVPEENVGMRNSVAVVLGGLYYIENDFNNAETYFLDAIQRDRAGGGTNALPIAVSRLVRMYRVQGRLQDAEALCLKAEHEARRQDIRRFYTPAYLPLSRALVLIERNRLEEAEVLLDEAVHLNQAWQIPQCICQTLTARARLFLAKGDLVAAAAAIEQNYRLLETAGVHPELQTALEGIRLRLWAAEGRTDRLEAWLTDHPAASLPGPDFRYEGAGLNQARALLAVGRSDQASTLLEDLARSAAFGGRWGSLIEILVFQSAALAERPAEAHAYLGEALGLAAPEGHVRVFLEQGEPIRKLLESYHARDDDEIGAAIRQHIQRLLKAFASPPAKTGGELPEPLTPRELEVLRLLAEGLSNQQIAGRLVISVRTVKKHVENIYAKLGAANRTHAVAVARQLGAL